MTGVCVCVCVLSCLLQNGAFTLSDSPNSNGRFDILVNDPTLLDYETTNRHNLVVEVSDGVSAHT